MLDIERELIDYYQSYCALTVWFKKIILHSDKKAFITIQAVTLEFIAERNRILKHVPSGRKRAMRKQLNKVATSYYDKISHWSRKEKITIDMV